MAKPGGEVTYPLILSGGDDAFEGATGLTGAAAGAVAVTEDDRDDDNMATLSAAAQAPMQPACRGSARKQMAEAARFRGQVPVIDAVWRNDMAFSTHDVDATGDQCG